MKKSRKIPFWMMPASWGLVGRSRDIAEAEYYFDGIDLEMRLAEINHPVGKEQDLAKLEIQFKHEQISRHHYERSKADLLGEPYVTVVSVEFDPKMPSAGHFELDWNEKFVKSLHAAGYVGRSDDDTVNQWFNSVCKSILLQERADLDFGLQQVPPFRDSEEYDDE